MTSNTMAPTNTSELVREHLKASKEVMKKAMRSKKSARAFLVKAGILTKSGKLAKPYRPD